MPRIRMSKRRKSIYQRMWELAQLDKSARIKILVPFRPYRIYMGDMKQPYGYSWRESEIITTSVEQLPIFMAYWPGCSLQVNCGPGLRRYDYILKEPGQSDKIYLSRPGESCVSPRPSAVGFFYDEPPPVFYVIP